MRLGQLVVTPADEQDRAHGADLAAQIQAVNGETVELADVDHGDTGAEPAAAARAHSLELAVVKQTFAKRGSVWLPTRSRHRARRAPGPRACAAWLAMTSVWQRRWPICMFWPSLVSCCISSPC